MFVIKIVQELSVGTVDIKSSDHFFFEQDENGNFTYDEDLHEIGAVVDDICSIMEDNSVIKFIFTGFGKKEWALSVGSNLPAVLVDIPGCISDIESGKETELDLYQTGNGILKFLQKDNKIKVTCEKCETLVESEELEKDALVKMLKNILIEFVNVAQESCVELTKVGLFQGWIKSLEANNILHFTSS